MAPLAQTLALLAMAMATVADEMKPLDMALNSFDDQYRGCGPDMIAALPALNRSEFEQNKKFAEVWVKATAEWQRQGPPESPLSPDQIIATMAFTMDGLHSVFNDAVRVAGRSQQEYRDNFHFKTLHFLLTQALATTRVGLQGQCYDMVQHLCGIWFKAHYGAIVRFGHFMPIWMRDEPAQCSGKETEFQVHTCEGASVGIKIGDSPIQFILIPPFETFEVINVTQIGDKAKIQLRSTGTYSKYNCEWLQGGSVPSAPFHGGGLLLATTALTLATGIL
ncbi:erythroblast NAD(P)(+)--arginine ADP-ribosyltransferase-like [Ammospiza nelsoni]|uniref:erythroblast NAD(P)(+)--arginine ADP-ribosyltransferase-like n=1 Tax=Ammospiza nelsoni TaxID=2857394 RepID=UPI002869DAC7|nr:erythroblast NAD(P)(+)--arginine ADP-ribosyltransferase-like [Ammospiza nelsoni]